MATIKVNPPPLLKRPPKFFTEAEEKAYFQGIETILFQLWNRTGGNNDKIEDTANLISNGNTSQLLDIQKRLGSGVPFTIDTTGFTIDTTLITTDKAAA